MPVLPLNSNPTASLSARRPTVEAAPPSAETFADLYAPASVPVLDELLHSKVLLETRYSHLTDSLQAGMSVAGPMVGGRLELVQEGERLHATGPAGEELSVRRLPGNEEALAVDLPGARTLTLAQDSRDLSYTLALARGNAQVKAWIAQDGQIDSVRATVLPKQEGALEPSLKLERGKDFLEISRFAGYNLQAATPSLRFSTLPGTPAQPDLAEVAAWKAEVTDGLGEVTDGLGDLRIDSSSPSAPLNLPRRDPFATLFAPDSAPLLQSLAADTKLSRGNEKDLRRALTTGLTIAGGVLGGAAGSSLTLQTQEGQLTASLCSDKSVQLLEGRFVGGDPTVHLPDGRQLLLEDGENLRVSLASPDGHEVMAFFDKHDRLTLVGASVDQQSVYLDQRGPRPFLRLAKDEGDVFDRIRKFAVPDSLTSDRGFERLAPPSLTEMARAKENVLQRLAQDPFTLA